eukprot:4702963-Pyramimonas_sp.AAC.1
MYCVSGLVSVVKLRGAIPLCCTVPRCTAPYRAVPRCTALYCAVLRCTALYCTVPCCTVLPSRAQPKARARSSLPSSRCLVLIWVYSLSPLRLVTCEMATSAQCGSSPTPKTVARLAASHFTRHACGWTVKG